MYEPLHKTIPPPQPHPLGPGPGHPMASPGIQTARHLGNQAAQQLLQPGPMSSGRHVAQRSPAPQPASKPTPAENVRDAIRELTFVAPSTIHHSLSQVKLDGPSKVVRSVTRSVSGVSSTTAFELALRIGPLKGHAIAEFQGVIPPPTTTGVRTFPMTITVDPSVASAHPSYIAERLYHEGLHMVLFMDRALPKAERSKDMSRMDEVLRVARSDSHHAKLLKEVAAYLVKHAQGKSALQAQRDAKWLVDTILEEKYISDETVRSGLRRKVNLLPSEKATADKRLATRWLVTYLKQLGAKKIVPSSVGTMSARVVALWLAVDKLGMGSRFATPADQFRAAPEILPPPLPVIPN